MTLSNTFPEMTDAELEKFVRHSGSYTITYPSTVAGSLVAQTQSSIDAFIELNNLEDTPILRGEISHALRVSGVFTLNANGFDVTITT